MNMRLLWTRLWVSVAWADGVVACGPGTTTARASVREALSVEEVVDSGDNTGPPPSPPPPKATPRPRTPTPVGEGNNMERGAGSLWWAAVRESPEVATPVRPTQARRRSGSSTLFGRLVGRVWAGWSALRELLALHVVPAPWFDRTILVFILANCVTLAVDNPLDPSGTTKADVLAVTEKV